VCFTSYEQLSVHPRSAHGGAGFPNNWYQSIWFEVVFDFCSKMKVVKIVFWPYHRVEENETKPLVKTASKSDVGHGRTLHHSPARRLPTRATRLLRLDGLTRPEYQLTRPTWLTRILMTSACTVGMPGITSAWCKCDVSMHSRHVMSAATSSTSQQTRQQSGTHLPHHHPRADPSRAELSRAVLKPSREIRFCAAESMCNRIWDWIWAVHQARIVLIKS